MGIQKRLLEEVMDGDVRFPKKGRHREIYHLMDTLVKQGYSVTYFGHKTQFRINGKVDVFPRGGKVFSLITQEWIDTTPDNIREIIDAFAWVEDVKR